MKKNKRPLKIDQDTHDKVMQLSRELSALEKSRISGGEVVRRILRGNDIPDRLRIGAVSNRRKKI